MNHQQADWLAARFEEQRAHLRAVTYRMLGSQAEAEDAVQNSWLRLSGADTSEVENLAGWLTTVVARECLKMLRSRRVQGATPPRQVDLARQRRVVDAFLTALRHGDFDALVAVLDPDVLLRDDSAGLPGGAAMMRGAHAVGAYALKFSRSARFVRPALVDGIPGLAIRLPGRLIGTLGFTFDGDTITAIDMISDRGRLRHVDLAAPGE